MGAGDAFLRIQNLFLEFKVFCGPIATIVIFFHIGIYKIKLRLGYRLNIVATFQENLVSLPLEILFFLSGILLFSPLVYYQNASLKWNCQTSGLQFSARYELLFIPNVSTFCRNDPTQLIPASVGQLAATSSIEFTNQSTRSHKRRVAVRPKHA